MTTYTFENNGPGDNPIHRDVFYITNTDPVLFGGWYWIPTGMIKFDPTGPFATEAEAIEDAKPC